MVGLVMQSGDCAILNSVIRSRDLGWGSCNCNVMHGVKSVHGILRVACFIMGGASIKFVDVRSVEGAAMRGSKWTRAL